MRRYTTERQELLRAAVPGTPSARRLARLTDEMLAELAEGPAAAALPRRSRWCLIALGGYGSGALLPDSDLDLLVVSNASSAALRPFVEALLYPLWDAGLKVGHQVRSRREQLAAIRQDLTILTATLTGRVIAGDVDLGIRTLRECAADAAKRSNEVLERLRERPRPGSPYLLEPDLKEGAGGRRDFDELTWTAAVLTGAPQSDPSPLVSLGLLESTQYDLLREGSDVICAARWELQLEGAGSFLSEEAAADLRTDPARVQRALADTHHLLLRTRRRTAGQGRPDDTPLSPHAFFDLVARGLDGLVELEDAAWAGRLDHLVCGMKELMTLRRPGIAHTLTVGAHSLACATMSAEILADASSHEGRADGDRMLDSSARRVRDREALWVASLTHDVGKSQPGPGHAVRGAASARAAAERFELDGERAAHVALLVEHHLLLAQAASGIDLDDPEAVTEVAHELGDHTLLAPLHVLTVADSRATGPSAWTPWHATLVGSLVSKVDEVLATGAAEHAAAGGPDAHRLEQLISRLAGDRTPGAHVLDVSPGPIEGTFVLHVAAYDRPGLLATIAGTFALAGLDILSARSLQSRGDIAVDTFVVTSATLAPVATETWSRLERQLSAALAGRLALGVRLAERRRHYAPRVFGPLTVGIEQDGDAALLSVRAPDRVGLLYDLARAISEAGLNVRSLTATSRAGWAEDTFRLRLGPAGGEGALGQLAMRLREL